MLLVSDLDAACVVLPEKDPDQLVQEGRLDELRGLLLGAPGALEMLIDRAREKATGSIQARVGAIDGLLPFLAAPARELVRTEAIRATARAFSEDEGVIAREVKEKGRRLLGARLRSEQAQLAARPQSSSSSSSQSPSSAPSSRTPPGPQTGPGSPRRALPPSPSPLPVVRKPRPASPPLNDLEVQLAKIVLCHPELAPRVALLIPHLECREFIAFVGRLLDALVRFHDLPPREALAKVPVARAGQLIGLADRVRLDGPDRVIGLSTALSMLEAFTRDLLERQSLEHRLGALQPLLSGADTDADHDERKRLLHEQKALVAALQALDTPVPPPLSRTVQKVMAALPPSPMLALPSAPSPQPEASSPPMTPSQAPPHAPSPVLVPTVVDDPPWAGDDDDPWAV